MHHQYSIIDFCNRETWFALWGKVVPGLEEAARYEFETVLGGVDANKEDLQEIREQAELIKTFLCSYVDGLAELHCIYAAKFCGDLLVQEELYAKLRSDRKQIRKRRLEDAANAAGKLVPKSILSDQQ